MQYDFQHFIHDYIASCFGAIYTMLIGAIASQNDKALYLRKQNSIGTMILVCLITGMLWPIALPFITFKGKLK